MELVLGYWNKALIVCFRWKDTIKIDISQDLKVILNEFIGKTV